jgi:hypothetical protein
MTSRPRTAVRRAVTPDAARRAATADAATATSTIDCCSATAPRSRFEPGRTPAAIAFGDVPSGATANQRREQQGEWQGRDDGAASR